MTVFWIEKRRDGQFEVDGIPFKSEEIAADMCVRMAQDLGGPYRIIYPL